MEEWYGMTWFTRSAVAVLILAGAALGGWACTDDEGNELTLEEYFAALEELDAQANEKTDALFEDVEDPTDVDEVKEWAAGISDVIAEFNAGLEGLDPPEEAQEAHDEAVAAAQAFAELQESTVAEAQNADTLEGFEETFNDPEFVQADERFQAACTDLAQIATDNDIEADLGCEQA